MTSDIAGGPNALTDERRRMEREVSLWWRK